MLLKITRAFMLGGVSQYAMVLRMSSGRDPRGVEWTKAPDAA